MSKNVVHLFTPGIDSFLSSPIIAEKHKNDDIERVYFDIGTRYSTIEQDFLIDLYGNNDFFIDSSVFMGDIESMTAHVPNRNVLLISMAQSRYAADYIYINGVLDDNAADNNFSFYSKMSKLLSQTSGKEVIVDSVLKLKEKSTCCKDWTDENPESRFDLLTNTYSCFSNVPKSKMVSVCSINNNDRFVKQKHMKIHGCLQCPACFRRMCALTNSNIFIPFENADVVNTYISRVDSGSMDATPNRKMTIMLAKNFLDWISTA